MGMILSRFRLGLRAFWNPATSKMTSKSEAVNLILLTDSYKVTHHLQYPKKLTYLKSYFESRGGKYSEIVFFGLQYFLKRYLCQRVTRADIDEAEAILGEHFGNPGLFNRAGWEYIVDR